MTGKQRVNNLPAVITQPRPYGESPVRRPARCATTPLWSNISHRPTRDERVLSRRVGRCELVFRVTCFLLYSLSALSYPSSSRPNAMLTSVVHQIWTLHSATCAVVRPPDLDAAQRHLRGRPSTRSGRCTTPPARRSRRATARAACHHTQTPHRSARDGSSSASRPTLGSTTPPPRNMRMTMIHVQL